PHTQAITLEVIMRAVFGIQDAAGLDELGRLLRGVLNLGTSRRRLLPLLFGLVAGGGDSRAWRRFQAATEAVDRALYAEIARRRLPRRRRQGDPAAAPGGAGGRPPGDRALGAAGLQPAGGHDRHPLDLPHPPPSRRLSRARAVPPRALPRAARRHLHLDPVRG